MAGGCSADGAFSPDTFGTTGDAGGDSAGTTGSAGTGTDGSETGLTGSDGTSSETDTTGGSGPNGTDGESADDACSDISCGGGGECAIQDGAPVCLCDDGMADIGLNCVPCDKISDLALVGLPTARITGAFTIASETPPPSPYEDGRIYLRNRGSGDQIFLGRTFEASYTTSVLHGTYDVVYEHEDGGALVPINERAIVGTAEITGDGEVNIDVPMTTLSGDFLINAGVPPTSPYERGAVVLVDPRNGDEVPLGETNDLAFAVNVIPGTYEVHYRFVQGGDIVPINPDHVFREASVTPAGEVGNNIIIDIPVVEANGTITLNDAVPPTSTFDDADLVLVDLGTDAEMTVGSTRDGMYAARIIPDTYSLRYRVDDKIGGIVPHNEDADLGLVDYSSPQQPINIQAVAFAGTFSMDDLPAPTSPYESGLITLRDASSGDAVVVGKTHDGVFNVPVIPGTYAAHYSALNSNTIAPANTDAKVLDAVMVGAGPSDINIATSVVAGDITINGQVPPGTEYEDGRIYLVNRDTGDTVSLGSTHDGSYSRTVVAGLYDVHYGLESGGAAVPVNRDAPVLIGVDTLVMSQVDVSVPAALVSASSQVNAEPAPSAPDDFGNLFLRNLTTNDLVPFGATNVGQVGQLITAGTYVIEYHAETTSKVMPKNEAAGVACISVQ